MPENVILIMSIVCAIIDAGLVALAVLYEIGKRKKAGKNFKASNYTYKLVLSAVFIGAALVLKRFSVSIPLFGTENGIRVGLTGVFSAFPALLCGPLFGGIASALLDVIGYFMNPTGPYTLIFTLTAFMAGCIRGFIWIWVRNVKKNILAVIMAVLLLFVGIFGVINTVNLNKDGFMKGIAASTSEAPQKTDLFDKNEYIKEDGSTGTKWTLKDENEGPNLTFSGKMLRDMCATKGEKSFGQTMATYANLVTLVLECTALLGIVFVTVSLLILSKQKKNTPFLNIFTSVIGAELLETTINTEAILALYGISLPFLLYWIPRVTESVLVCIIQSYLIAVLYGIYLSLSKSIRDKIEY